MSCTWTHRATTFFLLMVCIPQALAHNGARAVAYPIDAIVVDGKSTDWPEDLEKYPIKMNAPDEASDFNAQFRLGYNLNDESLYVLVEVEDDELVVVSSADQSFLSQDAHLLYLDDYHDPRGSGVSTYELTMNSMRKMLHEGSWDPRTQKHGLGNSRAVAAREGNIVTYEWRIHLGDRLRLNTTIGLDHEIIDVDADGKSRVSWGLFQFKSSLSNNLGDVFILADKRTELASLMGTAELEKPYGDTIPYGVSVTNRDHPALWTQFPLLRDKNFTLDLPVGRYQIESALIGNVTRDDYYLSSRGGSSVNVTLEAGKTTTAELLSVKAEEVPGWVSHDLGVLLRPGPIPSNEVDTFFENIMHFYAVPGLNLALVKDGAVVYEKSYGLSNAFAGNAVANNALFDSGSLTKPVFALLVMKLAEEDLIDLDRPLHEYYQYDDIAHDVAHHQLTARHVLTHRTGFPNWRRGQLNFVRSPGTFGYSGEGFVYLSKVVEEITGKDIEMLLSEYVTKPLNMGSTYFSANEDLTNRLVFGHNDKYATSLRPAPKPNMAYSMHTNASDFSKFMLAILNRDLLAESSYEQMLSDQVAIPQNWSEANTNWRQAFGLGLQLKHSPYGFAFGHSGRNGGYDCTFEVYSDARAGYVFFTNSSNGFRLKNIVREFLVTGKDHEPKR